jgi:hypothetical protein
MKPEIVSASGTAEDWLPKPLRGENMPQELKPAFITQGPKYGLKRAREN